LNADVTKSRLQLLTSQSGLSLFTALVDDVQKLVLCVEARDTVALETAFGTRTGSGDIAGPTATPAATTPTATAAASATPTQPTELSWSSLSSGMSVLQRRIEEINLLGLLESRGSRRCAANSVTARQSMTVCRKPKSGRARRKTGKDDEVKVDAISAPGATGAATTSASVRDDDDETSESQAQADSDPATPKLRSWKLRTNSGATASGSSDSMRRALTPAPGSAAAAATVVAATHASRGDIDDDEMSESQSQSQSQVAFCLHWQRDLV
jgi:hypothetical protein